MSRMFPFITHTVNPLAGGPCPYHCTYCWATNLKNRHKWEKYRGPWRIYEKELKNYDFNDFVFPFDMVDIGCDSIPKDIILDLMVWIAKQPCKMLLLTKNPKFYRLNKDIMPHNAILGTTIETNSNITLKYSKAPAPWRRLVEIRWVSENLINKTFICIEPIMKFNPGFERDIAQARPWAVAIGYDNYNNHLPEPSLAATKDLISALEPCTKVFIKTLRNPSLSTPKEIG